MHLVLDNFLAFLSNFPPNNPDFASTIFVYRGACKPKDHRACVFLCYKEHEPSCALECIQEKISQYLEKRRGINKKNGSVGLLTFNWHIQFSAQWRHADCGI